MSNLSLEITDLSVSYSNGHYAASTAENTPDRNNDVLRELSASFEQGKIHWLLGPNGAGKSTLFKVICGELPARRGSIRFENHHLNGLSPSSRVRYGIGRFLQTQWVFPNLSLLDNIRVAISHQPGESLLTALLPNSWRKEREITARAIELLNQYGFADRYDITNTPAGALSCGWAKLLSIVRLLVQDPKLWLLDEPIANVDERNQERICEIIKQQVEDRLRTVILIEHEVGAVGRISHLADRAVLMFQGKVVSDGLPLEVKASKSYRDVFGVA
jgi:ABC-type branched-subunit amino acid transport system ATPase component